MSWSMNWPKKVVPAVCVGLFWLCADSERSVIRSTGPRSSASRASSRPPGDPMSTSAASRPFLPGSANGLIRSKIRPKCCVIPVRACADAARGAAAAPVPTPNAPPVPTATAPTPTLPRKPRLLRPFGSSFLVGSIVHPSSHVVTNAPLAPFMSFLSRWSPPGRSARHRATRAALRARRPRPSRPRRGRSRSRPPGRRSSAPSGPESLPGQPPLQPGAPDRRSALPRRRRNERRRARRGTRPLWSRRRCLLGRKATRFDGRPGRAAAKYLKPPNFRDDPLGRRDVRKRAAELRPRADAELGVDVREVDLDGVDADEECLGDLLVGESVTGQLRDPTLGRSQLSARLRPPSADPGELCLGFLGPAERAELGEGGLSPLERAAGCAPLPVPTLRPPERKQGPSRVEAQPEPLVRRHCLAERIGRAGSVPGRELDQPLAAPRRGEPPRMLLLRRKRGQTADDPLRLAEIASLDSRLHQIGRDREDTRFLDADALAVRPD